ncbi:MAG: guanylate kinase [Candidatus Latescibacteria bacterium]|nr:guanylate kinase [Candidatus Latescibacterota bacterium]
MTHRGFIVVVSAPSGGGKTTICKAVLERQQRAILSVSATTRPRAQGEREGIDYLFVSQEVFRSKIDQGAFAEWAEVHGHLYGTLSDTVRAAIDRGGILILDIDIEGAQQIRAAFPDSVSIFIVPPSLRVLEERLRARGRDTQEAIENRLLRVAREMKEIARYDYVVINDDFDGAVDQVDAIFTAEGCRRERLEWEWEGEDLVGGPLHVE